MNEPLSWREIGCAIIASISWVLSLAVISILTGCVSPNSGSKTIVGEHLSLPEFSWESADASFKLYNSTKGAVVWAKENSKVSITYDCTYTNSYFGVFDSFSTMKLSTIVEPTEDSTPSEANPSSPK